MIRVACSRRIATVLSAAALGALLALMNPIVAPSPVLAHRGGLDKYGCHRDNKAGNYHCHRGQDIRLPSGNVEGGMREKLMVKGPPELERNASFGASLDSGCGASLLRGRG
jgi:hypothetical protein